MKNSSSKANNNQLKPSPQKAPLVHSHFKHVRRTLYLNPENETILVKLNIKRIHIRKIIEKNTTTDFFGLEHIVKATQKPLRPNLFKALTSLQVHSFYHSSWIENIKHFKSLRKFKWKPRVDSQSKRLLNYLKRINMNVEKMDLLTEYHFAKDLRQQYKTIAKFSKLKTFQTQTKFDEDFEMIRQELCYQRRYLRRLASLKDIGCVLPCFEKVFYPKSRKGTKVHPKIIRLEMPLCNSMGAYEFKQDYLQEEICQDCPFETREIKLRAGYLKIPFSNKPWSLERLHLNVKSHTTDTQLIFKGLLDLPQLSSFSLAIDFLFESNWDLLFTFLKKQKNLVSLKFEVTELIDSKKESGFLEDFLASLSQKPSLQYLDLKSNYWPLSILSAGLQRIDNTNQIKSFVLQTSKSEFTVPVFFQYPFQGLCEFLLRNKETLYELQLELPLLKEQEYHEEISKGISQLSQLKTLNLKFSEASTIDPKIYPKEIKYCDQLKYCNIQWNPHLHLMLKSSKKLENLMFDFGEMKKCKPASRKWMSGSFKILPKLKNLRNFEFKVPDILSQAEAKTINSALEKLKYLNNLNIQYGTRWDIFLLRDDDYDKDNQLEKVTQKVKTLRAQQDLRLNFSF